MDIEKIDIHLMDETHKDNTSKIKAKAFVHFSNFDVCSATVYTHFGIGGTRYRCELSHYILNEHDLRDRVELRRLILDEFNKVLASKSKPNMIKSSIRTKFYGSG